MTVNFDFSDGLEELRSQLTRRMSFVLIGFGILGTWYLLLRRDLPLFGSPEDRASYMEKMRQIVLDAWTPELLEQFFVKRDQTRIGRARFGFPWTATPDVLPKGGVVTWISPRPAVLESSAEQGELAIACNGKRWRFAEAAMPILERLLDRQPHAVAELEPLGPSPAVTFAFLRELVTNGLLSVAESRSTE